MGIDVSKIITAKQKHAEFLKRKQTQLDSEIQRSLEDFASTRGYTSFDRLCTYINSSRAQWAAEAARAVQLRDDTWTSAEMILNEVIGGSRPAPDTYDDIKNELPELTWGDL